MYVLTFIFWLILTQKFNLEIILFGLAITALVALFMKALFNYDLNTEIKYLKKVPLFIKYLGLLIVEIFKASILMIRVILSDSFKIDPVIVKFRSGLKTKMGNFILANSITLTPGTITIKCEGDKFTVHCLHRCMLDTSNDSTFISNIKKLEAK